MLFAAQRNHDYVGRIDKLLKVHATVGLKPIFVPSFVKNHGVLPGEKLQELLRKAKVRLTRVSPLWREAAAEVARLSFEIVAHIQLLLLMFRFAKESRGEYLGICCLQFQLI